MQITLPNNWKPRPAQMAAWSYLFGRLFCIISPARRLTDRLKHFMGASPASFAAQFFDRIAVKAKQLKAIHPAVCLKSLVHRGSADATSGCNAHLLSMLSAIVVNMVKTKRIDIRGVATLRACHCAAAVILKRRDFKLVAVFGFGCVVSLAVVFDPLLIPLAALFHDAGFGSVSLLILAVLFGLGLFHAHPILVLDMNSTRRGQPWAI